MDKIKGKSRLLLVFIFSPVFWFQLSAIMEESYGLTLDLHDQKQLYLASGR